MACPEFEDVLAAYAGLTREERCRVDAHLVACPRCREFLEALRSVDSRLTAQFASQEVPPGFTEAVRRRIQREASAVRPSFVPELLDFIGWSAIVALIGLVLYWLVPVSSESAQAVFSADARWAAGGIFVLVSFAVGLRSLAELKR